MNHFERQWTGFLREVRKEKRMDDNSAKKLTESGYMICRIDEDDPEEGHFWEGAGEGDKDSTRFSPGEELRLNPNTFPVGTRISTLEPDDPEFYRKMLERENPQVGFRRKGHSALHLNPSGELKVVDPHPDNATEGALDAAVRYWSAHPDSKAAARTELASLRKQLRQYENALIFAVDQLEHSDHVEGDFCPACEVLMLLDKIGGMKWKRRMELRAALERESR